MQSSFKQKEKSTFLRVERGWDFARNCSCITKSFVAIINKTHLHPSVFIDAISILPIGARIQLFHYFFYGNHV